MVKKMAGDVVGQLASLAADTAQEAIKQPLGLDKLTGAQASSSAPKTTPASPPDLSQMVRESQLKSEAELESLRAKLGEASAKAVGSPTRNLEKEIKQVREQKKASLEEKEKEFLQEVERKREEEELLLKEESLSSGPKPGRGSAFSFKKGSKKGSEFDLRRPV